MGLIESVDGNVKKLLHQPFKSAIQNLNFAKTATISVLQEDYLRRAKEKFIDATSVEENENLVSSLVGLSMCQHLLGDHDNVDVTLSRIQNVKLNLSAQIKSMGKGALKALAYPFRIP